MNNFSKLLSTIKQLHFQLQHSAVNAVNQLLTIRNWLIGYYIVEFEQNGKDRAEYGDRLIENLALELNHIKGIDKRSLFRFRQFYLFYPHLSNSIRGALSPEFLHSEKVVSMTPLFSDSLIVGSATPQLKTGIFVPGDVVLSKLSYTHIEQLLGIEETLFIQQYLLKLPDTRLLQKYIEKELKGL